MYRGAQILKDKIKDVIRALVDAKSVALVDAKSVAIDPSSLIRVLNPRQRIIIIRPQNG